jgi:hypothetical protein
MSKLDQLAKIEGTSVEDLLEQAVFDGVSKGICMNPKCDYTREVEPDQRKGYCEVCDTDTVTSAAVLANII